MLALKIYMLPILLIAGGLSIQRQIDFLLMQRGPRGPEAPAVTPQDYLLCYSCAHRYGRCVVAPTSNFEFDGVY